jgi:hypothetical protein
VNYLVSANGPPGGSSRSASRAAVVDGPRMQDIDGDNSVGDGHQGGGAGMAQYRASKIVDLRGDAIKVPVPTISLRIVLALVAVGIFASLIGFVDLVGANGVPYRLLGAGICLGGVLLLSGAIAIIMNQNWASIVSLMGCVAGTILGLVLITMQYRTGGATLRMVFWVAIMAASLVCAYRIWHISGFHLPHPAETKIPLLAIAGLALSISQFWYGSIYNPSISTPYLTVEAPLQAVDQGDRTDALLGKIIVHNPTAIRVLVLGSIYRISALRVEGPRKDLLQAGQLLPPNTWLEANQRVQFSVLSYVPDGTFNGPTLLDTSVDLFVARAEKLRIQGALRLTESTNDPEEPGRYVTILGILENSMIEDLTREGRVVVHDLTLSNDELRPDVALSVYIAKQYLNFKDFKRISNVNDVYGLVNVAYHVTSVISSDASVSQTGKSG